MSLAKGSRPTFWGQLSISYHVLEWEVIYFGETQISFLRHVQNALLFGNCKPLLLSFFFSPSCSVLEFDVQSNFILTE